MGTITDLSLAAANAVSVENVQFAITAQTLQRKIAIIGTYDPAKTDVVDNVPKRVFSAEDVGAQFGFGYMVHRLAYQAFRASKNVETWVIPQPESGGAVAASGNIIFTATSVSAGVIYGYIAGIKVPVRVNAGDDGDAIAIKVAAAISDIKELPVTAVVNGVTTNQVDYTAKQKGVWGNAITLGFNWLPGEELPSGLSVAITDMASGSGLPDIQDALDAMGTGDGQNDKYFTAVIHGYGQDTTTLDAISIYNGEGNDLVGNYDLLVHKPFRTLVANTTDVDTAGLAALIVIGNGRKIDRTNGLLAVPGSPNHPAEIAAWTLGKMENINSIRAEQGYIDVTIEDFIPGEAADRWTSEYDNRDAALKAGISPTFVKNGVLALQNIATFYHPDNVPQESNGFRSQRNISILQNLLYNYWLNFEGERWNGISIVEDVAFVTDPNSQEKVRDIDAVQDDLLVLADLFAEKAWLYNSSFTKDKIKNENLVILRPGLTGFNITFPVILSGEGGIFNSVIEFDTSIAILL
jgi:phage tail sheath gpL-like